MDQVSFAQKLHRNMTPERRKNIYQRISDPSRPSGAYYLLVCLSAVIATFGLLANSTAVVIGAMLVAPLMSPIFGIALGLSMGDRRLFKTAILAELAGIILAVALPVLIGLIPLRPEFGAEILARTQPTVYDVLIALASGLAGAYALVNEKISPALPGVAIATALVPPLASCGLNVAAGNWTLAGGAFLLFAVNFIAIEFAAAFMFTWFGVVDFPRASNGTLIRAVFQRLGISLLILLLAATFMTQTLIKIVGDRKLDKDIRTVLTTQLAAYAGARLSDVKFDTTDDGLQVMAMVITPQEFDPFKVTKLEEALQSSVSPDTRLIVRSVISKDSDHNGPVFISQQDIDLRQQINEETDYMNRISQVISEHIISVTGAQVTDVAKSNQDEIPYVTVTVRTPQAITPAEVQYIQQYLQNEVDDKIRLIVRSVITTDADADHYLYVPPDFTATLQGEDIELYQKLLNEVTWYLSDQETGIMVEKLSFEHTSADTIRVYATVKTPVTLGSSLVNNLQNHLIQSIDPRIKIIVNSKVGGTATAEELYQTTGG